MTERDQPRLSVIELTLCAVPPLVGAIAGYPGSVLGGVLAGAAFGAVFEAVKRVFLATRSVLLRGLVVAVSGFVTFALLRLLIVIAVEIQASL